MQKKILLINGSPRKTGLTNSLLEIFSQKIQNLNTEHNDEKNFTISTEILHLRDSNIQHCIACDKCLRKPYTCPLSEEDDMQNINPKLLESDAIIIASPSYFANVTGFVKDLIDRTRPLKMNKYQLKNKYFSTITTSGLRAGGLNTVQNSLIQYALIQGMIVIGALGHPVLMANLPTESGQKMNLTDFRKPNDVSEVAMKNIEALAQRFWEILF